MLRVPAQKPSALEFRRCEYRRGGVDQYREGRKMFYAEFYENRLRRISAEMDRKRVEAGLMASPSTVCKHRGKAALKALERLQSEYKQVLAAMSAEAASWED